MTHACDAARSTLVLIDLQERLMPAIHEGEAVIARAAILAQAAGALDVPVVGTAQYPKGLGPNVATIHPLCDDVIEKTDFDACAAPAFLPMLDSARDQLIVAGCEAHVCVLQTVFGLLERGHDVRIAVDAIGSRQPQSRDVAIERAVAAGAVAVTSEMVVFEWLRNARHPEFRNLSRLIK